jgi:hypothetical protein
VALAGSARSDAGALAARDAGDESSFDRATARALSGDLEGARRALEARVAAGGADREEIVLLRAICRQQRDVECLTRLRRGEAPR